MSFHCKKNGTWYVQYRVPGDKYPRREYTGVGPEGEKAAKALNRKVKEEKAKGLRQSGCAGLILVYLDQLAQAYLIERKLSGKSTVAGGSGNAV